MSQLIEEIHNLQNVSAKSRDVAEKKVILLFVIISAGVCILDVRHHIQFNICFPCQHGLERIISQQMSDKLRFATR